MIVLLYARDCPNVEAARASVRAACVEVGIEPRWREVDLDASDTPDGWRRFGSPTVLVDGEDVDASEQAQGSCCRVYDLARAPSTEAIARALVRCEDVPR